MPDSSSQLPWVPQLPGAEGNCLGVLSLPDDACCNTVALSKDGRTLFAGYTPGRACCWDLNTGSLRWVSCQLVTSTERAPAIALSPCGRWVVAYCLDHQAWILDALTGDYWGQLWSNSGTTEYVVWSPDSQRLAVIAAMTRTGYARESARRINFRDTVTRIYGLQTRASERILAEKEWRYTIQSLDWSPDGRFIVSCCSDDMLRLWNPINGDCLHQQYLSEIKTHRYGLRFSPDGQSLLMLLRHGMILILDATNFRLLHSLQESAPDERFYFRGANDVKWSPDNRFIAAIDAREKQSISIWHASSTDLLAHFTFEGNLGCDLAWSTDASFLVSAHIDKIRLWDTRPYHSSSPIAPIS